MYIDFSEKVSSNMKLSLLYGIPFRNWFSLLKDNHFEVSPRYLHRAALITAMSLFNSYRQRCESRSYDLQIESTEISESPIFILGHWRNGTSHLQRLLSQDIELATPNMFQTLFPYSFLRWEAIDARRFSRRIPTRRPEDQMKLSFEVPGEDEFALAIMSLKSLYMTFSFPRRTTEYLRYLDLRSVPPDEVEVWKSNYLYFLKKLTIRYRRPLVLKSPPNTARISILLDMFPEARFIHIHRNPYRVFQSMRHLIHTWTQHHAFLQRMDLDDVNDYILQVYRTIYDAYFDQVDLIPPGQFHEVRFEALEEDPIHELDRLYGMLDIGPFQPARRKFERYLESVKQYQKNEFDDLEPHLKERIAHEWRNSFEAWGYEI